MKLPNGMPCVCIADVEVGAKQVLTDNAANYINSGADDEISFQENLAAFSRIVLRPRMLRNVLHQSLNTTILGHPISMPLGLAPVAFHRLAHDLGEKATVKAAVKAEVPMTLSTFSTTSMEDVASAGENALLFYQLYTAKDRVLAKTLLQRAEKAGFKAVVVTVDAPVLGTRRPDERWKFHLPAHMSPANFQSSEITSLEQRGGGSALPILFAGDLDASVSWELISWIKSVCSLAVVVKGILTAEDAQLAWSYGCDAVWVSNHGGRQIDGCQAPIDALPEIVEVLKSSGVEIYVDGGIRKGTDIIKALALGANCVFIGRPYIWGLALGGEDGVSWVLETLRAELIKGMKLCGAASLKDIVPSMVKHVTYSMPPSNNSNRVAEYSQRMQAIAATSMEKSENTVPNH